MYVALYVVFALHIGPEGIRTLVQPRALWLYAIADNRTKPVLSRVDSNDLTSIYQLDAEPLLLDNVSVTGFTLIRPV